MKKTLMMVPAIMLMFLVACGSTDDDNTDTTADDQMDSTLNEDDNDANEDQADDTEDTANDEDDNDAADNEDQDKNAKMEELDFAEFELEVEYADNKEYEAEIEKKSSGEYEAELEDELNDENLKGDEAFDHLYSIVKDINVNPDSTKDEVFKEFLEAFELDENYEEIEVEITFHDGTELEYEEK